ncbi:MAG: hypothetical protein ACXVA9_02005, partial [Bdellovibrionales bacterium]
FSKSGGGAVMVRALNSKPAQTPHFFDPLTLFSAIAADQKAQGKDGKVMVGAGDSVFLQFAQLITFDSLEFILESFGDDDASIDIQFIWHGDNPKATQLITRRILNPPVYHSGGGNSSGSGNENTCQASVQCRGLEHCMDGQCIDVNRQPCATSGAHTCGPGESCCQGRCDSGSCH